MKTQGIVALFIFLNSVCFAQTLTDVARAKQITWYGVDFTKAKLVGFGNSFPVNQLPELVPAWSFSPLSEKRKNIFSGYFGKKEIINETTVAEARNSKIDFSSMLSANINRVTNDDIKKIVSEYKIKGSGYGVLMIVESYENTSQFAHVWSVFLNNATGEIISTRLFTGETFRTTDYDLRWRNAVKVAIVNMCDDLKNYK